MTLASFDRIMDDLRANAESIGRRIFPHASKDGHTLAVGSILGERGQSLRIYITGNRAGRWQDFASGDYGDLLDLIEQTQGCAGKGDAVAIAKDWLGIHDEWSPRKAREISPEERARQAEEHRRRVEAQQHAEAQERQAKIRGARALYLHKDAQPIGGTPGELYLRGRGLEPGDRWPGSLKFHPEAWCRDLGLKVPAMLAPIFLADGLHVATHRTFLQNDRRRGWTKIDSKNPKKVLGPLWGGFVPIAKGSSGKSMRHMPEGEPVYMTEGIEDALVVRMRKPEARIVAAVSLGNIGAVVLPEQAKRLVIVADRDTKPAAQDALERSIAQQQARGLEVSIVMPPPGIKDLNDWLREIAPEKGVA